MLPELSVRWGGSLRPTIQGNIEQVTEGLAGVVSKYHPARENAPTAFLALESFWVFRYTGHGHKKGPSEKEGQNGAILLPL